MKRDTRMRRQLHVGEEGGVGGWRGEGGGKVFSHDHHHQSVIL